MANDSSQSLLLLYEMVDEMTTENGFKFNWTANQSNDRFFDSKEEPQLYILATDEENVDDRGALGSDEYIDDQSFLFIAKVNVQGTDIDPDSLDFEQQQVLMRARDDVKKEYSSASYLCDRRETDPEIVFKAVTLNYNGAVFQMERQESKYATMRIVMRFTLKYKSERF